MNERVPVKYAPVCLLSNTEVFENAALVCLLSEMHLCDVLKRVLCFRLWTHFLNSPTL